MDREAQAARAEFERVFTKSGAPEDTPEHTVKLEGETIFLPKLLRSLKLATSGAEANRLLKQGAVNVDEERVQPGTLELPASAGDIWLIKVGKVIPRSTYRAIKPRLEELKKVIGGGGE